MAERQTSTKTCLGCKRDYEKKWSAANKEYIASKSALYRERHAEKVKAVRLMRYDLDPARYVARARRWEKNNPEQHRAIRNAIAARYRAAKRNASLPWLSEEQKQQILAFYDEAVECARRTGIKHDVDHIVPLRGKTVSGLHVPWNLRVIPARENQSKGNRLTI